VGRALAFVVILLTAASARAGGWEDYHRAFQALAEGKADEAREILRAISADTADPAADRATRLLARTGDDQLPPPVNDGQERPSSGARAEVILFQTIHGLAIGVEVCVLAECDTARTNAIGLMAGAGAGLAGSFFATRKGVTSGQAQAIDTGVVWGALNAAFYMGARDTFEDESARAVVGNFLIGQGAGLAAGVATAYFLRPTEGEVSVATTLSIWTTIMAGLTMAAIEVDDEDKVFATLLVVTDVALVGGAVLGRKHPMSRGRTLLIHAGGIVGGLAGLIIPAAAEPDSTAAGVIPVMVGAGAGLVIATWATRNWDARHAAPAVSMTLMPAPGGAMAGIGGTF
jgi:hypothetical protein